MKKKYLKDLPIVKLKKGVKTTPHDPIENLKDLRDEVKPSQKLVNQRKIT